MSVRFILGRSGTGKTSYCVRGIVDALLGGGEQALIFLVPEQASYQAERAILADKRIAGYNRLGVLSFDRLQFLLLGRNTARPGLSRIGRQMIIQRILRDNKDKLQVFGTSVGHIGLGRQMAETIAELHQYAKGPDDVEQLLEKLQKDERNSLAALKFADIGLVFREYLKAIEGKFIDPDVQLNCACRAVGEADFVKGAKLWVDGFASFTTSELAMLAELLKVSADAEIALCLDPSKIDLEKPSAEKIEQGGLFSPTERTYVALVEMIKKCKLKLDEPVVLEKAVRFSSSEQLAHIEGQIFEFEPAKISAGDNVRVVSAPNSRAEVRFVARQILQLVREKGYRYRDIAVIASDIESYQHYIRAYFEDYGIPFFIDKKKVLNQHAVVRLICSALEVIGGGFSSSDVFAYLKNDLVPVEQRDVDVLENYCVGFGISGEDWQSDRKWQFAGEQSDEFQEQRVNQIRAEAVGPLWGLREKLYPSGNLKETISSEEFTQAVFDFLDGLDVCGKLSGWIEEASERQDFAGADEHRQFYDKLVDVFDELAAAFEGQKLSCEDYFAIVNSAFSQLALAFIPLGLDQVLVGSIERSRHPDLKVVFLIGATQRQFPVPVGDGGILTDEDRIAAESVDFALAATRSEELAERQYLAYIAFTRGSEYLYVTYPVADEKGKSVARSEFGANLESLFEDFEEESIAGEQVPVDRLYNEAELAGLLCSELGRDVSRCSMLDARCSLEASRKQFGELLDDMCADEKLAELSATVLSAINYDNIAKLDKRVVEQLFGERIECSVTELGSFAACGYQHFARYVLELKERKEFKLEPLDLGVFEHKVLDGLLKKLKVKKKDFATVERGELLKFLRGVIAELIGTDSFIANFIHRSRYNTFIVGSASEILEDCVLAIGEMVRAGIFRPMWSEISFGKGKELGEYKIGLSGGRVLALDGKIDRLDFAEVEGDKIASVFDYKKRRDIPFGWTRFYYGLDMQLPIYMVAVRNARPARYKVKNVAGAFYMPVEVSPKTGTFDELSTKEEDFDYKARGLFNGQFFKQFDSQARSGWSKFYNFRIVKEGDQYGNYSISGALRPGDFEKVLRFAEAKAIDLAEEIVSGKIDVKPYRLNTKSPCSYCKYKAVCRFDWQINDYNPLVSHRKSEVLEKIGTKKR